MKIEAEAGGKKITVIGTAHISEESRQEVVETIKELKPDLVAVELDQDRLESLRNESGWRDLDIAEAVRDGKGSVLFMNLILSIYQKRLGMEEGVKPGSEMISAIETAEENGIKYSLIDRDVSQTLSRLRKELSFWEKMRLLTDLMLDETAEMEVEDLKDDQLIDSLIDELGERYPSIREVLLEERNIYMAEQLSDQEFEHAVVVVGAAHMDGIVENFQKGTEYHEGKGSSFPTAKLLMYGFPLLVLGLFGYGFMQGGVDKLIQLGTPWILLNGIFSFAAAMVARAHLSTAVISGLAAPLTSVNPTIGAGMVAAYVEARLHPPTVKDLETVVDIDDYRELWGNQAGRVLLTFVFVTVGSVIASVLGAGVIAHLLAFL